MHVLLPLLESDLRYKCLHPSRYHGSCHPLASSRLYCCYCHRLSHDPPEHKHIHTILFGGLVRTLLLTLCWIYDPSSSRMTFMPSSAHPAHSPQRLVNVCLLHCHVFNASGCTTSGSTFFPSLGAVSPVPMMHRTPFLLPTNFNMGTCWHIDLDMTEADAPSIVFPSNFHSHCETALTPSTCSVSTNKSRSFQCRPSLFAPVTFLVFLDFCWSHPSTLI